jgi:peptidoglycan/LPS O-acetylase OafA/YrhL
MMQFLHNLCRGVNVRDGHDNFFTPLRLCFALLVMIGHAFAISHTDIDAEPLVFFNYTLSYLAVNLFFIASGFLVTGSMLFRKDGSSFASARLLRIYPALVVHLVFILFILGPIATRLDLSAYFLSSSLWLEPFKVLSFVNTDLILPGVFEGNGEPYASAPLWTLRYEMLCYGVTLAAFSIGIMRKRWMVLAQFTLPAMVWIIGQSLNLFDALPSTVENMVRFASAYGLGAAIFAYRDRLSFRPIVALPLLLICVLFQSTPVMEVVVNLLLALIVMTLAFARAPRLEGLKRLSDLSYGIYIYHWGVMQLIFQWNSALNVPSLFLLSLGPVVILAWLSWTYVEKPMLAHKTSFEARLGKLSRSQRSKDAAALTD